MGCAFGFTPWPASDRHASCKWHVQLRDLNLNLNCASFRGMACRLNTQLASKLTVLRQTCCHPQIVRRGDEMLGPARLSMRQIMGRLLEKTISEYDQVRSQLHSPTSNAPYAGVSKVP